MELRRQGDDVQEPWRGVLDAWVRTCSDSRSTRDTYRWAVEPALRDMGKPLAGITALDLTRWREQLMAGPLASSSKGVRVLALRRFLLWAVAQGHMPPHAGAIRAALPTPRRITETPRISLSDDQVAELLWHAGPMRPLIAVFVGSGARIGEVVRLDRRHLITERIDGQHRHLLHIQGKGLRDRRVPLTSDVAEILVAHLATRPADPHAPMFARLHGSRLEVRGMRERFAAVVERCPFAEDLDDAVTPHVLRHTAAMRWLRAGMSVTVVKRLLGHSTLATTMVYVDHLELSDLTRGLPRLPSWRRDAA